MVSDKIRIQSNGNGLEEAVAETERIAQYFEMSGKDALRLRLLAEETLGMVRTLVGGFDGRFFIEVLKKKDFLIHVEADTIVDHDTEQALLSASRTGENEAAKGFMGKIGALIRESLYGIDSVNQLQMEYGGSPLMFGSLGMYDVGSAGNMMNTWSLSRFRENLEEMRGEEAAAEEAWDELEKSIVAKIADDVRVSVTGTHVEMVIEKAFH